MTAARTSGNQPPCSTLIRFAEKKREVHHQEQRGERAALEPAPAPPFPGHHVEQQRRDRHRPGHRDAVGGGQVGRGLEARDQGDAGHHQPPVHLRDVDLSPLGVGGVLDGDPGAVAQLNRLLGQREGAGDERLAGDDGGRGGDDHHRVQHARGAPGRRTGWSPPPDGSGAAPPGRSS